MILAKNRNPMVPIFLSAKQLKDSESTALYAAKELRYYLDRMTCASFQIEENKADVPGIYLGDIAGIDKSDLGEDGFIIFTHDDRLYITGGKRGVIYGVYEFLESLGCRFFTSNCEKIPTIPELSIGEYDVKQKPCIEYREHNYSDATQNPRFAVRCRFNGSHHRIPERMGGYMPYAWYVHSFEKMVPTAVYGETHPEYYSLVDGKRVVRNGGRTQLCLTNPDVFKICVDAVRKALTEHPEARLISISQNDWHGNCQCESCLASDREDGSPAGTLLRFVNRIAEELEDEFPDVIFDTLAYTYSRPAPKHARNRKNVCVRLCSIEACFAHPFETCDDETRNVTRPDGSKANFITDLRDWGKICDRMYIWDYTTCFSHYPTPHPNWRVLQPNIQAMVKNNVRGIFEQANGASRGGVDFNELRLYLISKLLWDPWCDVERHRREFMEYFYGDAAPALMEYLDLVCDTADKENIHVGFNDQPIHGFLREELLDKYDELFDRAAEAVKGDPLRLWRVEKNRLSIRYVRIKRASMLRGEYDPETINKFFADWRAYNLSRLDEWANIETSHRAFIEGKWRGTQYFEHWTGEEQELF